MKRARLIKFMKGLVVCVSALHLVAGCEAESEVKNAQETGDQKSTNTVSYEWTRPSTNESDGGFYLVKYKYGMLSIPRHLTSQFRLHKDNTLFFDVEMSWPEFDRRYQSSDDPLSRVRLLFYINKQNAPFKNMYEVYSDCRGGTCFDSEFSDSRYVGMVGYRLKSPFIGYGYVVDQDVLNVPMGTPLLVLCGEDRRLGIDGFTMQGSCSFNLIFDDDLRVQVRFNKPLLKDFISLYKDVMNLIQVVRGVQ